MGDILETKVLIVSHDVVGPSMAGSGMRYWFLAQALASEFSVVLVCPLGSEKLAEGKADFRVYDPGDWSSVAGLFGWADVAVIGSDVLQYYPHLVDWSKKASWAQAISGCAWSLLKTDRQCASVRPSF